MYPFHILNMLQPQKKPYALPKVGPRRADVGPNLEFLPHDQKSRSLGSRALWVENRKVCKMKWVMCCGLKENVSQNDWYY